MSHLDSTRQSSKKIAVGGKVYGILYGQELRKSLVGSRHFLRKPPAIALDKGALDRAEQAGAVKVRVVDQETGIVYLATIAHLRRAGLDINRGWGAQLALPLESWVRRKPGEPEQLDLFGKVT